MTERELDDYLRDAAEPAYAAFSRRLTPTAYPILGVRIPALRKIAASAPPPEAIAPDSFEKVMVRGFATARLKLPPDDYAARVEAFLPLIDNWAVCDCFASSLKPFAGMPDYALDRFSPRKDGGTWERRFVAVLSMDYCLTDALVDRVLDLYAAIGQGEYYVDMGIAWGLATAAVKYFDRVYDRLAKGAYSASVVDKTISKARDSYRIPPEQKAALRALRGAGR